MVVNFFQCESSYKEGKAQKSLKCTYFAFLFSYSRKKEKAKLLYALPTSRPTPTNGPYHERPRIRKASPKTSLLLFLERRKGPSYLFLLRTGLLLVGFAWLREGGKGVAFNK
uniref:Uncharacterized protein ORF111_2 n=1 Tax=Phaeoceros laevis TaxID=37308 RepID=D3J0L0_9EMBR|nr:hypothetical protein PhlaMp43 [Phaeoceros laevis]ACT75324.1 hypothetical protein PhlaMp43 [Phaeoceros laevis]